MISTNTHELFVDLCLRFLQEAIEEDFDLLPTFRRRRRRAQEKAYLLLGRSFVVSGVEDLGCFGVRGDHGGVEDDLEESVVDGLHGGLFVPLLNEESLV